MDNFTINMPNISSPTPIEFVINFAMCIFASFILRSIYLMCARSLTGRQHVAPIIPIMSLITFLIIMVVKSSLALSLGLVGALSIVRFRTPIKEPEELVYLFLSISLGLGFGAGLTLITSCSFIVIIIVIFIISKRRTSIKDNCFNLMIDWTDDKLEVDKVVNSIKDYSPDIELVKFASKTNNHTLFLKVELENIDKLSFLRKKLQSFDNKLTIVFSESRPVQ